MIVNVLRNLGVAGGTIVGKALSACGAFLFSETNPRSATILGQELNALVQLRRLEPERVPPFWRDIDANAIGSPPVFGAFIRDAVSGFDSLGRSVIVRDHSYTDFIGVPFVWPAPQSSSLDAALVPLATVRDVVLVRHPVSTFRSLRGHPHYQWCLDGPTFVEGALRFHRAFQAVPTVRYEAFLTEPDRVLRAICATFDIAFRPDWRLTLGGAVVASGHPRALTSDALSPPEAHEEDWLNHREEMRRSKLYGALLGLSGYADDPREPALTATIP